MTDYEKSIFKDKCPYTDKPCKLDIDCAACEVNEQEKQKTEKMDNTEYEEYKAW